MFDRTPFITSKPALVLLLVYLIPATMLYGLLVWLYSHWSNGTIVMLQALWLGAYGPPLVALWAACIVLLRSQKSAVTKALPKPVVFGLCYCIVVVICTIAYAAATYPWPGRMHMGPAFAAIAIVSTPGFLAAALLVRARHGMPRIRIDDIRMH